MAVRHTDLVVTAAGPQREGTGTENLSGHNREDGWASVVETLKKLSGSLCSTRETRKPQTAPIGPWKQAAPGRGVAWQVPDVNLLVLVSCWWSRQSAHSPDGHRNDRVPRRTLCAHLPDNSVHRLYGKRSLFDCLHSLCAGNMYACVVGCVDWHGEGSVCTHTGSLAHH